MEKKRKNIKTHTIIKKTVNKLLFSIVVFCFICIHNFAFSQWTQQGADIDGKAAGDASGVSVSMSADGLTVAIGSQGNDGAGTDAGQVRVYKFISGTWAQQGADINGEAAFDNSGWSVSMSADGLTVAIGAPGSDATGMESGHVRVYKFISGTWEKQGGDIDGEAAFDNSGTSVSMSADGLTVAIAAYLNDGTGTNAGHVRVYKLISGTWEKQGDDLDGEAAQDWSGYSISMSDDGLTVAIGAISNSAFAGHVRVYKFISGAWEKQGGDIDGEVAGDQSGTSLSMSADGLTVAIGADRNDATGTDAGHVRVFKYNSGVWTQQGDDIDGEAAFDASGISVSMSSDGLTVAIGAPLNGESGAFAGHVRVYKFISGAWEKQGDDIDAEEAGDRLGTSVSLSANGLIVAIGAIFNDGAGSNAGHVRVYSDTSLGTDESSLFGGVSIFPNPVKEYFTIQLSQSLELQRVNIYNSLGQFISSTTKNIVRTTNFSQGIYFVEIETNQGKATKKIVVE